MQLVGARGQQVRDIMYSVSGTTSGTAAMLVLPEQQNRSSFIFQNLSANPMFLEIGAGEATATLTSGVVTSVTVVNAGFNYTIAPQVYFFGGGNAGNPTYTGATDPTSIAPGTSFGNDGNIPTGMVATAHAVVSAGAITSIVVDYGGTGYTKAPWVLIANSPQDPNGCAVPSSTSGIYVAANSNYTFNGTVCTTSPVAVYCATSGSRWQAKFTL